MLKNVFLAKHWKIKDLTTTIITRQKQTKEKYKITEIIIFICDQP